MHQICTKYEKNRFNYNFNMQINMHNMQINMQKVCKKYARSMQEVCKKYAIFCTTCKKYAKNNMHIAQYAKNMQNLNICMGPNKYAALSLAICKICKKYAKICQKYVKYTVDANCCTNMQNMHPGPGDFRDAASDGAP